MNSIIETRKVSKTFPGTLALSGVDFQLLPGEIHALVGENGAGKSTLMHILAGVLQPSTGELIIEGSPMQLRDPEHAQQLGISTVFQELALFPNLNVAENVFTNSQPVSGQGLIKADEMYRATEKALEDFGVQIDPRAPLYRYSVAVQQIVEIARAIQRKTKVLILDEPTSAIGERETERLMKVLKMLRDKGVAVIYISHKLDEVFALAQRITVLKDGRIVETLNTADTNQEEVVHLMVGRELSQMFPPLNTGQVQTVMQVRGLSGRGYEGVDLDIAAGEVLGVFGLTGAGRTELVRGIFGIEPCTAGKITMQGKPLRINSPSQAMQEGLAYITEDRKEDGLFLEMSLKDNAAVGCLGSLSGMLFINSGQVEELARDYIGKLSIKCRNPSQPVSLLSGGNQQKVLFAKWLARKPMVLIADEPTRGVDVGAKAEIHALLRGLAEQGAAVVMISSELPEILGMSDKVAVMREGKLVRVFDCKEASEDKVGACALGAINQEAVSLGEINHG
jgi:ABC-type sugar transport system ATPase subunit